MLTNDFASENSFETRRTIPELVSLGDVPLDIEIVLDQRVMTLGEILGLRAGSILTLAKPAGEPLDVMVSGELFGHGEIEVSHDNVGLRISGLAA